MAAIAPTVLTRVHVGAPTRIKVDLAPGQALAQGNTYRARLIVDPEYANRLSVRAKVDVSGGTPTLQLVPQTADVMPDSLAISDVTTGLTAATNVVDDTELNHILTLLGDRVVDVVISTAGALAAGTVTYVDVAAYLV